MPSWPGVSLILSEIIVHAVVVPGVFPSERGGKSEVGHPAGILSAESDSFLRLLSRFVAPPLNLTAGDHHEPQPTYNLEYPGRLLELGSLKLPEKEITLFAQGLDPGSSCTCNMISLETSLLPLERVLGSLWQNIPLRAN